MQKEEFEGNKGVTRIRKQKKNKQHNGQKKKYKGTNNDLQNTTQKTKDGVIQTPLKSGGARKELTVPAPLVTSVVFSHFYYYRWVDPSAGVLLVPDGTIRSEFRTLVLTYMYIALTCSNTHLNYLSFQSFDYERI